MANIELKDVTKIFPFIEAKGLFNKKKKQEALEKQKNMPYTSNEGVVVLQHINLKIKQGEFVVVLGASGSGKSTLLRIIAGLEQQSLGEVYFNDEEYSLKKPEDRNVAMVFQNYSLYPHLDVKENIAYPLKVDHVPQDEIDQAVEEIAELVGIDDILKNTPNKLSGGQAQRVAICRALIRRPEVFLLDEPLSNLDNITRNILRKELKRIHSELNTTFVYVTHDQMDALYLADRVIVLNDGIIEQDASLSDLYNYPNNIYCATFLGNPKMNIINDIEVKDGKFELFNKQYHINKIKQGKVSIGIRPINIVRSNNGVDAVVDYSEQIESDVVIHVQCDGKEICLVEKANKDLSNLLSPGLNIKIDFQEDMAHIFDKDGNRVDDQVRAN